MTLSHIARIGLLSLSGLLIAMPAMAAEQRSGAAAGGGSKMERQGSAQHSEKVQQSDKMQREKGQQQASSQTESDSAGQHTGSDLTGGRDSHLGPQNEASQGQKGKGSGRSSR